MLNQFNVSIWGDEAFSAILSMKTVSEIIEIITRDTSPPLYNLTEHFWFSILGSSEIAIRSLSFTYYLIAVFFVYKIGEYFWDKKTGSIAALLTFLNPFFFIYAFEGRMYSMMAAGVAASMYFFVRKNWIGHIIATTIALYTHHFAIFIIFVQGLWFLKEFFFGKRKIAFSMLKSFLAIGVLYSPWIIPLYKQTKMVGGGFWLGTPTFAELKKLIYDYLAKGVVHRLDDFALWTVFAIAIFRKWEKDFVKTAFLLTWFFLPILATWLISQKFQSIFYNRYLLYTIPAVMLILASSMRKNFSVLIVVLLVTFSIIDWHYFTNPTKLPFRDLANYVLETKQGDDYVVNWMGNAHYLWESKYYKLDAPIYTPNKDGVPFFVGTALMQDDDIIDILPKKVKRIGIITSNKLEDINLPDYKYIEHKEFGNLNLIWYSEDK